MSDRWVGGVRPVSFGERLAASGSFSELFREGMKLVEDTAAYLDGHGRVESKQLARSVSGLYAAESMRLTTRLMQLASWLLLHRAVNEGEMSVAQARKERNKVKLSAEAHPEILSDALPEQLLTLIDRSKTLQTRIMRLDATIYAPIPSTPVGNPFERQLVLLRAAFEHP